MTTLKKVKFSERLGVWVATVGVKAGDAIERVIYSYNKKEEAARSWADAQILAFKADPRAPVVFL